jgi:hypothetical protein
LGIRIGIGIHYGIALNVLSFQQNTQIYVIKINSTDDIIKKAKCPYVADGSCEFSAVKLFVSKASRSLSACISLNSLQKENDFQYY